ncbi:hypothetical protein [Sinosporangium siamense]|uniref:Uncharacterized protein n=1 Tax=Sinosporangium siamense TaxID=1367973 RepID=A0A919RET0_9ACTN|nr:hypothetical protein [Sinosporangium siamense]GII91094.1 hypothetical protein Ssi02_13250 [Sinosporangium siamense]
MTFPDGPEGDRRRGGQTTGNTRRPQWAARAAANPVLTAAVLLILVAVLWKWVILSDAYFREDDFEYIIRGLENPLDLDYLTRIHWGHLMPGGFAMAWALARVAPYQWELTSAITLAGHALGAFAAFRMLRVLFGTRPAVLVPFAVYLFTPLTLPALSWWAAALNLVPLQIAAPMAITAHVHYLRTGRRHHLYAATGWIAFGLLCFLKAGAIPLLLFGLTVGWFAKGRGQAALKDAAWRHRAAWALYSVPLALYAILYLSRLEGSASRVAVTALGDVAEFARRLITETFPTAVTGMTWSWTPVGTGSYAIATPGFLQIALSLGLLAAVVGGSLLRGMSGWQAWALLTVYLICADVMPIALGRLNPDYVGLAGAETRYLADAAFVFMLCLALAYLPTSDEQDTQAAEAGSLPTDPLPAVGIGIADTSPGPVPATQVSAAAPNTPRALRSLRPALRLRELGPRVRRRAVPIVAAGLAVFGVSSLWSGVRLMDEVDGGKARRYLDTVRAELADASHDIDIFDRLVPSELATPLFGIYAHTSRVLAPLAKPIHRRTMRSQPPSDQPYVIDDEGKLTPMGIWGTVRKPPSGSCWPQVGDTARIPIGGMSASGETTYIVKLEVVANREVLLQVRLGQGSTISTVMPKDRNTTTFGITGGGGELRVTSDTVGARFCVTAATVGFAVPGR